MADDYAPEHLEVQTSDPEWYLDRLRNYGTLCVGEEATITFSDKAIGTNHTLPTGRAARYTGGLWVGKFLKTVTYQRCTREGALAIAPHAGRLADAEHMFGHGKTAYSAHRQVRRPRRSRLAGDPSSGTGVSRGSGGAARRKAPGGSAGRVTWRASLEARSRAAAFWRSRSSTRESKPGQSPRRGGRRRSSPLHRKRSPPKPSRRPRR